jgi:hypothetical protein
MALPPTQPEVLDQGLRMLKDLFSEIAGIENTEVRKESRGGKGPDAVLDLSGRSFRGALLIGARSSGEPRHAREAVNSLLVLLKHWSHAHPLFVAPYISDAAAAICKENGVGFIDLAGNCCIAFDTIYVRTEGRANPFKRKRGLKTLSRPKSASVLRVLLNQPLRSWQTQELAREAGVSLGLVSNIRKLLKDREWIDPGKKRILLLRPDLILAEWAAQAVEPSAISYYSAPRDFIEIENALVTECGNLGAKIAFTGLSAAVHLASGIEYYRQVQAYVQDDIAPGLEMLGFTRAPAGDGNVAVIQTDDSGVFYGMRPVMPTSRLQYCRPSEKTVKTIEREIRTRIHIVSPVQIYLDLKAAFSGLEKEAEKIYRQVLEPSW